MDEKHNPSHSQDDSWLDDILSAPDFSQDLGPDEQALSAAGLTHSDDLTVEQIIHETKSQDNPVPPQMAVPEPFRDQDYRDAFGEGTELAQMFDDTHTNPPTPEPAPKKEEPPVRKGRPKMKKGYGLLGIPHVLVTFVWLAIILAIGVTIGRVVWLCAADVLAFGRTNKEIEISITPQDNIDTIATKLKNAGLIQYPELFKMFANLTDAEEEIGTGTFTLDAIYDYNALVKHMRDTSSDRQTVDLTIPEGYTCAQIFKLMEEKGICAAADLEEYAANGELKDYWFLEGVERGDKYCLEGYLFPDTYKFYTNDSPERVLNKLLRNFDVRFSDDLRELIPQLNNRMIQKMEKNGYSQDYIDSHMFTVREVVIVASMIEKESANTIESYTIGSVIYNRLTQDTKHPNYLNIDATIVYALGGKTDPLTQEDLALDSPYNTYKYTGLTPGPISNPGLNSISAALDPDETDYFYYALNPAEGEHHFSKTLKEHEAFLESLWG